MVAILGVIFPLDRACIICIVNSYLSVTSHINCIVAHRPDKRCLSHGMPLYQFMVTLHFLNDVANDAESTQKTP